MQNSKRRVQKDLQSTSLTSTCRPIENVNSKAATELKESVHHPSPRQRKRYRLVDIGDVSKCHPQTIKRNHMLKV